MSVSTTSGAGVRHREARVGREEEGRFRLRRGVTILNDLTCRDLQKREVASDRASGLQERPGFGPLGPEIVTMDEIRDPYDLWLTCSVNGEGAHASQHARPDLEAARPARAFLALHPDRARRYVLDRRPGRSRRRQAERGGIVLEARDVVECSIEAVRRCAPISFRPNSRTPWTARHNLGRRKP